jgi:hypothetical protein
MKVGDKVLLPGAIAGKVLGLNYNLVLVEKEGEHNQLPRHYPIDEVTLSTDKKEVKTVVNEDAKATKKAVVKSAKKVVAKNAKKTK